MNVAWWVRRWSELHPEKTAINFENRSISYAELHDKSEAVASWLQSLGIEKGDRVAVLLDNCPEFIELYLACARLGAIFVPFNFRLATPEIDYLLVNCRPRLFVFRDALAEKIAPLNLANYQPPLAAAVVGQKTVDHRVLDYANTTARFNGEKPFVTSSIGPSDPEEPQVIMYTSGTTGHPKGSVLTYKKTFFNCLNANIFFKASYDDIMLLILPLFHSGGLFIQLTPMLYHGGTILLHHRFDPGRAYADIQRHRVTKFLGVPTVYRALLDVPAGERGDLSSLRVCAIGGEQVTPELLRACRDAGLACRQIMGQTETSILLWASEEESLAKPGTVGRPVFHAEVRLVAEDGSLASQGQVGEIVARGPVVMKEYWRDPKRTEDAMSGGWLHTGDLGRSDEEGYYYLMDRARDMFISGGENVYPAEVERVLKLHPAVAEAAVVGVPDPKWGEVGHAFVILHADAGVEAEALHDHCRDHLAAYKVPHRIAFVKEFPRTPLGKVRKFLLLEKARQGGN
ncbi:long-chain fatty acid--CoA ligase [Desulfocarbo indianensis]|nr:long-chain fatty acid--CoA ligase [Desulfocarbo indianensis]